MKHTGGCHCGKVKFEVELEIGKPLSCNCSICQKKGTLLSFAAASEFKLLQGEDSLTDYQFNKNVLHHLFCKHCGVTSFVKGVGPDGKDVRAINVRCLDGVELENLELFKYDGRTLR